MQLSPIDDAKKRRDAALQAWRHEFQLLKACKPGSSKWLKQNIAVTSARAEYSKAAEEYLEMLVKPDRPKHGAA